MDQLLSNPRGLIIILCFGVVVVALNLSLLAALRGDKRFQHEATRWTRALSGGRETRQRQDADAAELNRLVKQLKENEQKGTNPPDDQ